MKQNKIEEIQKYLAKRGLQISEVAIVNVAIDIARRLGVGDKVFALEFEEGEE